MPQSELRLASRVAEYKPKADLRLLPRELRGIYVLYYERKPAARASERLAQGICLGREPMIQDLTRCGTTAYSRGS